MLHGWLLLLLSLPPRPSSLRVRAWRRLRGLGAVPLKSSAYLLPDSPDRYEQFQWLAQEIQRDGGEATLLRVDRIENMQQPDVVRLFQEARNQDYAALAERYRKLLKWAPPAAARRGAGPARPRDGPDRRDRLLRSARPPGSRAARGRPSRSARPRGAAGRRGAAPPLDLAALKGRRWVTRPRPHVDRIASAWLIKRFVDPEAEFVFAPPDQIPGDAIPFDMAGVDFGHQGEDCTFETLLRRTGLRDRKLAILAEIVHEADIKDQKFAREEARGIDLALRALLSAHQGRPRGARAGMTLFDGLYATVGERA